MSARAMALHARFPCFDGHNDLPWALYKGFGNKLEAVDLSKDLRHEKYTKIRHGCLHTDIPRLREGGAGAQFWSVYVPFSVTGSDAVQATLEQVDVVHRLCKKYPATFEFACTAADVRRIFGAGKIASLCGAEGGHQINNSLATLRMFHRIGIRYMTLTHNGGPGWAEPALTAEGTFIEDTKEKEPPRVGLTPFGCEVVREMNRLGMLVDISHVHADTMRRALEISESPVIMSHSCARALADHPRNVPDDVFEQLRENGGICMMNFNQPFVGAAYWTKGAKSFADLSDVCDHIDHMRKVAGVDHIGIGADFDGIKSPAVGLEDVSKLPKLTDELLHRGYSDDDIGKILGLNALRVLEQCETVAERLQLERGPSEATREELDGPAGMLGTGGAATRKRRATMRVASAPEGKRRATIQVGNKE